MKEIHLKSGKVLSLGNTPFSDSKALFQALLNEGKSIPFHTKQEFASLIKDLFCFGFSSPRVESALNKCLERCLYDGLKIDEKTFDSEAAREDYMDVCLNVIEENIRPFLNGLYAGFGRLSAMIPNIQA